MDSIASKGISVRDILTEAIRYWEPRRVGYNAVLAAVVVGCVAAFWPHFRTILAWQNLLPLFVLAVLANVCYCACYLADIPLQLSGFRGAWHRWRFLLWLIGAVFAAVIACYFMMDEAYVSASIMSSKPARVSGYMRPSNMSRVMSMDAV